MKPLFERILGADFADLPEAVRKLHSTSAPMVFSGKANVEASWLGSLLGFPRAGHNINILFMLEPLPDGRERWIRDFGNGKRFTTVLSQNGAHLIECWGGIVKIKLALDAEPEGISWQIVGNRFCGLPVPRLFWPKITAKETTENGKYHFSVAVTGLVSLKYAGWLEV